MLLPSLDPGITLLDIESGRGVPLLQSLVLDHLLLHNGPAFWIDAKGYATTTTLSRIAPSQRLLNRIHVARGFTVHQHTSLVDRLEGRLDAAPAVVLATGVDQLYRDDDVPNEQVKGLFVRAVAALAGVAREHDIPFVVTRTREDEFTVPLANAATTHLQCRKTPFDPHFGEPDGERETLVNHAGDGWMQTTLTYWQEVLEHRARMHESLTTNRAAGAVGDC